MLQTVKAKRFRVKDARIAIVASLYNARYVEGMLRAAKAQLKAAGVERVQVIRVPGAFEIPVVAASLARSKAPASHGNGRERSAELSAIVCLGVILRGETTHAAHIGEAVSRALMEIQVQFGVPIVHEVLLLENEAQAKARCLTRDHNRGTEAAQTALTMAQVMKSISL
jgi:6,7-dimethyl-8-ribityllumazine synthase